jgi:hypothetical protein
MMSAKQDRRASAALADSEEAVLEKLVAGVWFPAGGRHEAQGFVFVLPTTAVHAERLAALAESLAREWCVSQPLEHSCEDVMGLGAWDEQPVVDQPGRDAVGAELECGAGLRLDAVEVALVMEGVDNVSLLESDRGALLDEDTLFADVARSGPVGIEQARVECWQGTAFARQLCQHQ